MAGATNTTLDAVDVTHARDRAGNAIEPWARRAGMLLLTAITVLALLNVFGQQASDSAVQTSTATFSLHTPSDVRRGLLYESRLTIAAHVTLAKAVIRLNSAWADGQTMNTIEPSPVDEASDNGDLVFTLGRIRAGTTYVLHLDFQVNPTTSGHRTQTVMLYDGSRSVATITRHLTVWP